MPDDTTEMGARGAERVRLAGKRSGAKSNLKWAGLLFVGFLAFAAYKLVIGESGAALIAVVVGALGALLMAANTLKDFAMEWVIGGMSKRTRHVAAGVLGVWLVGILAYDKFF